MICLFAQLLSAARPACPRRLRDAERIIVGRGIDEQEARHPTIVVGDLNGAPAEQPEPEARSVEEEEAGEKVDEMAKEEC